MKFKEKLEDISYSVSNAFDEIRRIYQKITGTFEYLCFMWKNDTYREWDYAYLYDFIEFKLNRMSILLRDHGYGTDCKERYKEIQEVIANYHVYKTIEDGEYDRSSIDAIKSVYKMQQEAWDKMHDIMKKHGQGWWD